LRDFNFLCSGIGPGYDSATGFPVRSHHLSSLSGGTAVKGELRHHNQHSNTYHVERRCQATVHRGQDQSHEADTQRIQRPDIILRKSSIPLFAGIDGRFTTGPHTGLCGSLDFARPTLASGDNILPTALPQRRAVRSLAGVELDVSTENAQLFDSEIAKTRAECLVCQVLKDTLPVHGPSSEYTDDLLWEDFTALLDRN
jgi:hypothetical protein